MASSPPDRHLVEGQTRYRQELTRWHTRNSLLFYLDGLLFFCGFALLYPNPVLAGLVEHHLPSATLQALLMVILVVGIILLQPLGSFISQRRQHRKGLVLTIIVLQKLPLWALACCIQLLPAEGYPRLTVAVVCSLFAIFSLVTGLGAPIWMDWMGRVLHPELRGRILGLRTVATAVGGLTGGLLAQLILGQMAYPHNYRLLLWLGAALTSLTIPCLWGIVEMEYPVPTRTLSLGPFLRRMGRVLVEHREYRQYVLALSLLTGALMVPGVALRDAQLRFPDLEALGWTPDAAAGRWNTTMWISYGLAAGLAALVTQRHGFRPALVTFGLAAIALPLAPLVAPSVGPYSLVFVAAGVYQAAFFMAHLGTLYALTPGEDRLPYLGMAEFVRIPVLLATLVGAWLLDRGGLAWANSVFGAVILLSAVGLWLLPPVGREQLPGEG